MEPPKEEWIGASDLLKRLRSDPEWAAREKARDEHITAERARLRANEQPIVTDLHAIGWAVDGVWDLVNSRESYPEAVPVLVAHLDRPYDWRIREGIIRALTVPEARGDPARRILDEFKRADNENEFVRWALANALTVIADRTMIEEIEALLVAERQENVVRLLRSAVRKARKRDP